MQPLSYDEFMLLQKAVQRISEEEPEDKNLRHLAQQLLNDRADALRRPKETTPKPRRAAAGDDPLGRPPGGTNHLIYRAIPGAGYLVFGAAQVGQFYPIGTISKLDKGWKAVPVDRPDLTLEGAASRQKAAEYLLKTKRGLHQ